MKLYCCQCTADVDARLTDGREIYPHRKDLAELPFWICDACGNYVGCHHKTKNPTAPLGSIPTRRMMTLRKMIHATLDPLWKSGQVSRGAIYAEMSERIGWNYHTAKLRSDDEAVNALNIARAVRDSLGGVQ